MEYVVVSTTPTQELRITPSTRRSAVVVVACRPAQQCADIFIQIQNDWCFRVFVTLVRRHENTWPARLRLAVVGAVGRVQMSGAPLRRIQARVEVNDEPAN